MRKSRRVRFDSRPMQPVDTGMVEVTADAERRAIPVWTHVAVLTAAAIPVTLLTWYATLGAP